MTNIAIKSKTIRQTRADICGYTGCTTEKYNHVVHIAGGTWAESHCANQQGVDALIASKEFWGWWNIEWQKTSEKFIDTKLIITQNGIGVQIWIDADTLKMYYDEDIIMADFSLYMVKNMLRCRAQSVIMEKSFHNNLIKKIKI